MNALPRPMPAYELTGEFFELCDCFTICPCWVGQPPSAGRCTGAFGWFVARGRIGEVDVTGRRIVSVSFHTGHRDNGGQEVYIFVDDGASDEAYPVLVDTFTGQLGGPLGELGKLMGFLKGSERAPITLETRGDYISVTVGRVISGDAAVLHGPDGEVTELRHGRLSDVLGPLAEVAQGSDFRIDLGEQGLSVEVNGRAAMRGSFTYESAGDPA
jgi:hypothetical protein